jgi:hypothetical protein
MVNIPRIKQYIRIPFGIRHVKTAGLAGLVCGASVRPNLLEGGGSGIRSRKVQEVILGITAPDSR